MTASRQATGPGPRGLALAALVACLCGSSPAAPVPPPGSAPDRVAPAPTDVQWVIPAGRERVVRAWVVEALGAAGLEAVVAAGSWSARLATDRLEVGLTLDGVALALVVVPAPSDGGGGSRDGSVRPARPDIAAASGPCGADCSEALARRRAALVEALTASWSGWVVRVWERRELEPVDTAPTLRAAPDVALDVEVLRPRPEAQGLPWDELPGSLRVSWVLAALAMLLTWLALGLAVVRRRVRGAEAATWLGVVAGGASLLVWGIPWSTVHDHNAFVARAQLGLMAAGDHMDGGTPWGDPTYHVLHGLWRLVPFEMATLAGFSVVCSLVALAALMAAAAQAAALCEAGRGAPPWRLGVWAGLALLAQPLFLRTATSTSFYPWAVATLWVAVALGLHAVRRRSPILGLAAACSLTLCGLSVHPHLLLMPLALLAPLAWAQHGQGPGGRRLPSLGGALRWAVAMAPVALVALPETLEIAGTLSADAERGVMAGRPLLGRLELAFWEQPLLGPRTTPVVVGAAALAGVVVALRRAPWLHAPVLLAAVLTEGVLGGDTEIWNGYPTRFLMSFASTSFVAWFAAVGAEAAWRVLAPLGGPARLAAVAVGVAALAALPPTLGWAYLTDPHPLSVEAAAFEAAGAVLPPSELLILPPELDAPGYDPASDVIEVHLPLTSWARGFARRGEVPPPVTWLDQALAADRQVAEARPELAALDGALLYVGSALRSFYRADMLLGLVDDRLERPLMRQLRARYRLDPVHTFRVPTAQPALVMARLGADRVDTLELGFYRLVAR